MTFENEEQAYREGKAAGKKSLTRDAIMFIIASIFCLATEWTTWTAGVRHGIAITMASDYTARLVNYGITLGAQEKP